MIQLLYITCANEEEAIKIAHILLAEKLIACANIVAGSTSIYQWQGEINQQKEAILFAKTTNEKTQTAINYALKLHSYDLPCILALPIETGSPEFINWVQAQVS
jgi:periplasmic divalent cation tolerance protein